MKDSVIENHFQNKNVVKSIRKFISSVFVFLTAIILLRAVIIRFSLNMHYSLCLHTNNYFI